MNVPDLYTLREYFNRERTLLCFNGPISRSLIEEIGNALKHYLSDRDAQPSAAMDVFGVYIEMTQNIRHYATCRNYDSDAAAATVVVGRNSEDRYVVSAGNCVEPEDGEYLLRRVQELAVMDKAALKAVYKEQLRKPRDADVATGAGLGLIDIARKASAPLSATLVPSQNGRAFFSLRAVI